MCGLVSHNGGLWHALSVDVPADSGRSFAAAQQIRRHEAACDRSALPGVLGYVAFMVAVDVPMYLERWQTDLASGKELLGRRRQR